jgi:putative PIN family toxin of toxin-antitoxin system
LSLLRRVVLDTSTLVGAALKPGSVPHQALLLSLARADVCASVQTWLELERVMQHRRFDRYLARGLRLEFAALLRQSMQFFAVTPADEAALQPPCRDTTDNKFLALVQVCQANVLVSSDDDLLVLNPWCGVPVLRPAEFLARMGAA